MAIRPEDCTFITGYVGNDGAGDSGWGIAAYLTTIPSPQATPAGYLLGWDGALEGDPNIARMHDGAIERVDTSLYYLGNAYGIHESRRASLISIDASDVAAMTKVGEGPGWGYYDVQVSLCSDDVNLYGWWNDWSGGRWMCSVWAGGSWGVIADGGTPSITWTIPVWHAYSGRWHHAVSRGALYVINPTTWRLEVWDCTDASEVSLARELALPDNLDPNARVACDDSHLVVGCRHFAEGAWHSALITYSIADALHPTESWRIAEAPIDNRPAREPIGIVSGELVYRSGNMGRVYLMGLDDQVVIAESDLGLDRGLDTVDWDVRDGLIAAKVRDRTVAPPAPLKTFELAQAGTLERLPGNWAFEVRGYGWWPSGWIGAPEELDHRISIYGPGIVAGLQLGQGGIDMWTDATGGIWTAWADGGTIYAVRMSACAEASDSWGTPVAVATQAGVATVGISGHGDRIHVAAQLTDGSVVEWRSVSGGATWEGPFTIAT